MRDRLKRLEFWVLVLVAARPLAAAIIATLTFQSSTWWIWGFGSAYVVFSVAGTFSDVSRMLRRREAQIANVKLRAEIAEKRADDNAKGYRELWRFMNTRVINQTFELSADEADWFYTQQQPQSLWAMSAEDREAQRRSFAYGNAAIDNPAVTREIVDRAAASSEAGKDRSE